MIKQKHTKQQDHTQAASHSTTIHSNNIHSYLSTQISQELRYYGLTCCDGVHERVYMCGRIWCKQSYTKQGLDTGCSWKDTEARTDLMIVDRNTESRPHHHQAYGRNRTCPVNGWQGRIVMERKAYGHCPFLMTKISKGCQSG